MHEPMPTPEIGKPTQIKCEVGDVVFAHYQLGYATAANTSSNDRIAVYFRVWLRGIGQDRWQYLTNIGKAGRFRANQLFLLQMSNIRIPANVKIVLKELVERLKVHFSIELIGVYLHGSLAMGGFNEISSDIDILIITQNKLSLRNKKDLGQIILEISEHAPANGFELSVISLENLKNFVFPTPYEFHFGKDHLQEFKEGKVDFTDGKTDPDLAAHFVITKERGVCLFGRPIAEIFPDVPRKYYLDSVTKDVEWSYERISKGANNGKLDVPDYGVLNFCRVIALIKEGLITSKLGGGIWALENLPKRYHPIIREALKEKTKSGTAEKVEAKLLKDFAEYSIRIIRDAE